MIGYVTLGSKDIAKASEFYNKIFDALDGSRVFTRGTYIAWSIGAWQPMMGVIEPANGEQTIIGNSSMVALKLQDTETVNRLHALALELGGVNKGDPGMRSENFYASFFRVLDGHKINFYCKIYPKNKLGF